MNTIRFTEGFKRIKKLRVGETAVIKVAEWHRHYGSRPRNILLIWTKPGGQLSNRRYSSYEDTVHGVYEIKRRSNRK